MMTGGRQVLAACPIVLCHLQLAARRSATEPPHREVTSPQAMAPCAACAPAGRCPQTAACHGQTLRDQVLAGDGTRFLVLRTRGPIAVSASRIGLSSDVLVAML